MHPKIDASMSCDAESICIGPYLKIRQILYTRTMILMPFALIYVMVVCHYISKHRIRFKVGFTCGRRLAMPKVRRTNNSSSMLFLFFSNAPLRTQGRKITNNMEQVVKKSIGIIDVLLSQNCDLKDMALVHKLQELEKLLSSIDSCNLWQEIPDFSYNDRWWTTGVIEKGQSCRKRRTVDQFYRQYGCIPLREYLQNLKKSLEAYLKKNYNII